MGKGLENAEVGWRGTPLLLLGGAFCALYLVIDASIEAFLLQLGSFWQCLGTWNNAQAYERIAACALILGLAVAGKLVLVYRRRIEERAREGERRYQKMLELAHEGVWLIDAQGDTIFVNPQMARMIGYSVPEMMGRSLFGFADAPEAAATRENLEKRAAGLAEVQDFVFLHKDGHRVFTRFSASPVLSDGGDYGGALAFVTDLTAERTAAMALRDSEEKYAKAFQNSPDAVTITRLSDGKFLEVNEGFTRLTGYGSAEAVGATSESLGLYEDPQDRERVFRRLAEGGSLRDFEARFRRRDGSTLIAIMTSTPLTVGNEPCVLGTTRDITEQKRAESELRASEARARGLFQAVSGGVVMQDREGRIVAANPAACEILGVTLDQMRGLTSMDPRWHAIREDGSPMPVMERPLQITLRTGMPVSDVVTGVFNPVRNEYRWLLTNSQPILDGAGKLEAAVATFVDITERRQTQALVEASLKEKEVLLKEVHHRVKNNLQIISTLLDLKAAFLTDPDAVGAFRDSQNRVRAMALIHEKLYRSENLSQVDFRTYLADLLAHLSGSFGVPAESLVLEGEDEGLPLSLDSAVPVGLLLNELVCNSLKHAFPQGPAGTVRVVFRLLPTGERELTVADDGVGIGAGTDCEKVGTLGLQLVWTLVRQLGGSIERLPGPGTTFRIVFLEHAERQAMAR